MWYDIINHIGSNFNKCFSTKISDPNVHFCINCISCFAWTVTSTTCTCPSTLCVYLFIENFWLLDTLYHLFLFRLRIIWSKCWLFLYFSDLDFILFCVSVFFTVGKHVVCLNFIFSIFCFIWTIAKSILMFIIFPSIYFLAVQVVYFIVICIKLANYSVRVALFYLSWSLIYSTNYYLAITDFLCW